MTIAVVCWNIAKRQEPWQRLVQMGADVALPQETTGRVPPDVADEVDAGPGEHWHDARHTDLYDRWPMVVKLSERVEVELFRQVGPISQVAGDEIAVSGIGAIAAARVIPKDAPPFVAVSMYARWTKPQPSTDSKWGVGYADGSAHRIL